MRVPDVNLLLYAYDMHSPNHARARHWLTEALSGAEPIGFAWITLVAFIRITTRSRLVEHPLQPSEAFEIVEAWLAKPNAVVLHPTERHLGILRGLLEPLGTAGNLTTDAHLAALATEHGAELCSADSDFGRFPGLRWVNPLQR
jgi:toxin-antitoxin system PIN domain toxin